MRGRLWTGTLWAGLLCCGGSAKVDSGNGDPTASHPAPAAPQTFLLTVEISGQGSVKSEPAGIDCSQTCKASFPAGVTVVVSAAPGAGYTLASWNGACGGQ